MSHARKLLQLLTLATTLLPVSGLLATEPHEPAWRAFQHALGQPARIGDNTDHALASNAFRPIPPAQPQDIDEARFELGFRLFHEGRLSTGNAIACVTCHAGALSGADRRHVSTGVGGARGTMNALSVFNATFNFRQFWDGRSVTLEDQALEPVINEVEMANTLDAALAMLRADSQYPELFEQAYADGVTISNMADAIAHFQRINFIRHDTPFQHHLNGDENALDAQQQRGLQRFTELACASCHNGINLGGNSYQQLGTALPFYGPERAATEHDDGVMARTDREHDRHVFRVPGLHGVSTTAPYFHNGSIPTLEEAVAEMAKHQLGLQLSDADLTDITAFLRALSGPVSFQQPQGNAGGASTETTFSHVEAYEQAILTIAAAEQRLHDAATEIGQRKIDHFDFLQFEHRELIRHARALQHPPATLAADLRATLATEAGQLLAAVNALEWPIADFLRAAAMSQVYAAQLREHGAAHLLTREEINDTLTQQQALAGEALTLIHASDLSSAARRVSDLLEMPRSN